MTGYYARLQATALAFALFGTTGFASTQTSIDTESRRCQPDRPCFIDSRQVGTTVVFQFNGVNSWEFYNLRYATTRGEKQVENRSGSFTLTNVSPRRVYTLKVQGCNSHTLARSTCSPWVQESVTTR